MCFVILRTFNEVGKRKKARKEGRKEERKKERKKERKDERKQASEEGYIILQKLTIVMGRCGLVGLPPPP